MQPSPMHCWSCRVHQWGGPRPRTRGAQGRRGTALSPGGPPPPSSPRHLATPPASLSRPGPADQGCLAFSWPHLARETIPTCIRHYIQQLSPSVFTSGQEELFATTNLSFLKLRLLLAPEGRSASLLLLALCTFFPSLIFLLCPPPPLVSHKACLLIFFLYTRWLEWLVLPHLLCAPLSAEDSKVFILTSLHPCSRCTLPVTWVVHSSRYEVISNST